MAVAAATVTREMLNHYISSVSGGVRPSDLYITPLARDFIPIMSTQKTPLLDRMPKASMTVDNPELVFGEGDYVPKKTTLAEADDGTETVLTVANARIFQQWDIIRFGTGSERALVVEAPTITGPGDQGDIVVRRRYAGVPGSSESHDNGVEIHILGPAVPEGADTPDSPVAMGHVDRNWCQILEWSLRLTHRGQIVPDQEIKSDRAREFQKRLMKEAMLDLDDIFMWGVPYQGDGTATNPMTTGGLLYYTTAHTNDLAGDPLELIDILTGLEAIAEDVGQDEMGKTLMGSFKTKRIFNSFFGSRRQYQGSGDVKLDDNGFSCDFGSFKFDVNYRMKGQDKLILWNPSDCKRAYFEGGNWSTGYYSTQGWYDHLFLRADLGVLWTGDRRRGLFNNFSLSDADYPNLDVV